MKEIKLEFVKRIERTKTISSFRFIVKSEATRPKGGVSSSSDGAKPAEALAKAGKIDFLPGQYLELIFDENNRFNRELNKYLSFSSSSTKDYIEVTKRLSQSQFSQRLMSLKAGASVLVKAPLGNCVFKDEYKKIGFLIGGIGITPIICILEYINDKKLGTDVLLLYSNKSDDDMAFRKEIDALCVANKNIKVVYTITDCKPKDEMCIFGFIDKNLIAKYAGDLSERTIFIYGPPAMVDEMKKLCSIFDCRKENIKTESFIGY